jgi:competence protein ComEA
MDPDPMPWRAIDRASATTSTRTEASPSPGLWAGLPLGPIAVTGAAVLILVAAFVLAFGSATGGDVEVDGATPLGADASGTAASSDGAGSDVGPDLVVEIVGAVQRPGVYHVPPGARIGELVEAAGGYGPRVDAAAASRTLNLAARLADGDQVRVPSRDDATPLPAAGGGGSGGGGTGGGEAGTAGGAAAAPVDLNTATSAELEALPGIGPATAAKIIAAREEARFTAVEDLRSRKLLGQKTFDGLRELVTVH